MACTANEMITYARSFIGTKEYPANSNKTKFGEAYGANGVPWCCIFQWYIFNKKGMSDQFYDGKKTASCTTFMNWAKSKKKFYTSGYQPGDIVLYNFDKVPDADHIGIITRVSGNYIYAVEGNTSKSGSQDNGGAVLEKERHKSLILGVYRPTYKGASNTTSKGSTSASSSASNSNSYVKKAQAAINKLCGTKISEDGLIGTETKKGVRKALQVALNKDYKGKLSVDGVIGSSTKNLLSNHYVKKNEKQYLVTFVEISLMVLGYYKSSIEYPGVFGSGLESAVKSFQKNNKLSVDGKAGRETILKIISKLS